MAKPKTTLLLSGGMDSTAIAYWKRPDFAITIDYGQLSASGEIRAATAVCQALAIPHHILEIPCRSLGAGDMAGEKPSTYSNISEWWPFRNQLLVTMACAYMCKLGSTCLLIGSVKSDASHRDGTSRFYTLIDELVHFQEGEFRVSAPAIEFTTAELVALSEVPMSLLAWSHSCHKSSFACGNCRGCNKHREVMEALGLGCY